MIGSITLDAEKKMKEVIAVLAQELKQIHTGRANTGLVENILVSYYGQQLPIKGMANLSIPEPHQIVITPWDNNQLVAIEAAIKETNLGFTPNNDGRSIRINLPPLTSERREQLIKQVKAMGEEARIELRSLRHQALETIKKDFDQGIATEDDKFTAVKKFDEMIDQFNKQVNELILAKEKELAQI